MTTMYGEISLRENLSCDTITDQRATQEQVIHRKLQLYIAKFYSNGFSATSVED